MLIISLKRRKKKRSVWRRQKKVNPKRKEEGQQRRIKRPQTLLVNLDSFLVTCWFVQLLSFIAYCVFILSGEAIEKMLQEKKISSKINYEALKMLNSAVSSNNQQENNQELSTTNTTLGSDDSTTFNKPYVRITITAKLIMPMDVIIIIFYYNLGCRSILR